MEKVMEFNASDVVPPSIHLIIIDNARKGLDDVGAGKLKNASAAINTLKRKRRANAVLSKAAR